MYSRASNRSRMLLVVLIILAVLIITFHFRAGGVLNGLQRAALSVIAPVQKMTSSALKPIGRVTGYTIRLSEATEENLRLKARNEELTGEVRELRRQGKENKSLRDLAGFRSRSEFELLAANIISRSPTSWQSLATIDLGSADGVKKRMSVLTEKGLIGQVSVTTKHTAVVRLLDDRQSGAAVEVVQTGSTGIVEGRMNGEMRLRFVTGTEDIEKGDKIITSGIGGVHPRGIAVGAVNKISETPYSLEKQIEVEPAVKYRRLEKVFVITGQKSE